MIQNIATVITAVGVVVAVLGLRASQRQRMRQFETLYVQRYWSLMDGLSLEALRGRPQTQLSSSDEKVIRAYIRLCEDQLELRKAGWISDASWTIWRDGMDLQFQRWPCDKIWHKVDAEAHDQSTGATNEYVLLRDLINKVDADPCKIGRWRKLLAGLSGPSTA